jgi:hypothetical protein
MERDKKKDREGCCGGDRSRTACTVQATLAAVADDDDPSRRARWARTRPSRWHAHEITTAYHPPASSTFISEQTNHWQPTSRTLLSQQTSTSHQPPANRTGSQSLQSTDARAAVGHEALARLAGGRTSSCPRARRTWGETTRRWATKLALRSATCRCDGTNGTRSGLNLLQVLSFNFL